MMKRLLLLAAVLTLFCTADLFADDRIDYSDPDNWAYFGIGENREADLFLIAPTVDMNDEYNMSMDDEETKSNFLGALNMERGIYEDSTRMYAPYYRQMAMKGYELDAKEREQYLELAFEDLKDAFAWYIDHENEGRPIIVAGFSQGADMCYRLLQEFELADQLVAVYALGWPCTTELVENYPQIRPAEGALDTGVVISFDCEAPELEETFITPTGTKAFTINPLTWNTDSTPADKSENKGACFTDYSGEIQTEIPEFCGCYIDESRGILKVTDVNEEDYPSVISLLPEGSYHIYDYLFFFRNLQENVAERLAAFLEQSAAADAA